MIDRETGHAIANLMHHLRPEWDTPGCIAVIGKLRDRSPLDVAMAAIRLCATPGVNTPGALATVDGPHWRERITAPTVRFPPKRGDDCPKHPGQWPASCSGCASDRLAGTESPSRSPQALDAAVHVNALRQIVNATTATFCSHGVDERHCNDDHQEDE